MLLFSFYVKQQKIKKPFENSQKAFEQLNVNII